jgi:RNA polymerase sigma-70 factor (ECF subfamily)
MIAVGESDYRDELARLTPSLRAFARALVEGHHEEVADELVQAALISVLGDRQAGNGLRLRLRLLATLLATHRRSVREAKADQDAGTQNKTAPHGTVRSGRWAATHRVVGRDAARLDEMPLECREILLLITLESLTYVQAAECAGTTLNGVVTNLARARSHLGRTEKARKLDPVQADGRPRPVPYLRLVK